MSDQCEWTWRQSKLLNAAAEKIIRVGEEVGVTPEEMLKFLDSGGSVRDLVIMVAAKRRGVA